MDTLKQTHHSVPSSGSLSEAPPIAPATPLFLAAGGLLQDRDGGGDSLQCCVRLDSACLFTYNYQVMFMGLLSASLLSTVIPARQAFGMALVGLLR
jgi:hypothetical protein